MGYKIAELRKAQRMSQAYLAQKSGVSRVAISLIERGKTQNVSSKVLLKLANALGVSIDELFNGANV